MEKYYGDVCMLNNEETVISLIKDDKWISGFNLASHADLLYHDGQYTHSEYKHKKGWGHSSVEDAILFASMCKVKQLLIAHHDPSHSDEQLDKILANLQLNYKHPFKYEMAEEGKEFELA